MNETDIIASYICDSVNVILLKQERLINSMQT